MTEESLHTPCLRCCGLVQSVIPFHSDPHFCVLVFVCCQPAKRAGPFRAPSFALLSFTRSCAWTSWNFIRYCVDWKTPLLSMAASVFLLCGTTTFTTPEALPSKSE